MRIVEPVSAITMPVFKAGLAQTVNSQAHQVLVEFIRQNRERKVAGTSDVENKMAETVPALTKRKSGEASVAWTCHGLHIHHQHHWGELGMKPSKDTLERLSCHPEHTNPKDSPGCFR